MKKISQLRNFDDIYSWQKEFYVDLHKHPELSMQEERTRGKIREELEAADFTVTEVGGGVVGVLKNGEGPAVLFRADFDALPVKEETGLPYASTATQVDRDGIEQPVMHACGHDFHTTNLLGAAKLLSGNREMWSGTVIALFQPGEETAEGAQSMVDSGLIDAVPAPVAALSQHVLTKPVAGHVGIKSEAFLSSAASIEVVVFGKGSHGSMPHLGVDPVVLASAIVMRLQTIVSREISPAEFAVITVGSLRAGSKANIIPGQAVLNINVRAYDESTKKLLIDRIKEIVIAECEASRAPHPAEFRLYDEYPLTTNDDDVTQKVRASLQKFLGEDRVEPIDAQTASEDFSRIPDAFGVPYCYWGVGGFEEGQDVYPNHNSKFGPAMEPTILTGTEAALAGILAFVGR